MKKLKLSFIVFPIILLSFTSCSQKDETSGLISPNNTVKGNPWQAQLGNNLASSSGLSPLAGNERCWAVDTDSSNNVVCAGLTTSNVLDGNSSGQNDVLITKFSKEGKLLWSKQLGESAMSNLGGSSSGSDLCQDVAVDSQDNIICVGHTNGSMFDTNGGSDDLVIVKYDKSGNFLWGKQFGTSLAGSLSLDVSNSETCSSVYIDEDDNIYCGGNTSGDFQETSAGGTDAIVVKITSTGSVSTVFHLGATTSASWGVDASGSESCYDIDGRKNFGSFCSGYTTSSFAETSAGSDDVFYFKLNSDFSLGFVSQIGSVTAPTYGLDASARDRVYDVVVGEDGSAYLAGLTTGSLKETNSGSYDAFVAKVSNSGNLSWLTHLGQETLNGNGAGSDIHYGIDIDSHGNLYTTGHTDGYFGEASTGAEDVFILKFSSSGSLTWIKQIGDETATSTNGVSNTNPEACYGIAIDKDENPICGGVVYGDFADTNAGGSDLIIAKLLSDGSLTK